MFRHEDARRCLIEMTPGEFRACKVAIVKERSILGDHFHALKDERFLLVAGHAICVEIGGATWTHVDAPFEWNVPRGTYHAFDLAEGSILVGTATEEFNAEDERKDVSPRKDSSADALPAGRR
jgi:hypothetical protein